MDLDDVTGGDVMIIIGFALFLFAVACISYSIYIEIPGPEQHTVITVQDKAFSQEQFWIKDTRGKVWVICGCDPFIYNSMELHHMYGITFIATKKPQGKDKIVGSEDFTYYTRI
jgi:hypothetical protein